MKNSYLNARREWNERYGNYISREKWWRIVALFSLTITFVCVIGLIQSNDNKLVPYFIEIDKFKRVNCKGFASNMRYNQDLVVRAELNQLLEDMRLVTVDNTVQKKALHDVYVHFSGDFAAIEILNEYFKKNNPLKRSTECTVEAIVSNILKESNSTWKIEWTETKRNRQGQVIEKTPMKASITLVFRVPESEEDIIKNPIGMFVKELSWSKILN